MYTHIHAYTRISSIYPYIHEYTHKHMITHAYTHIYARIHAYTCIYTYIHTFGPTVETALADGRNLQNIKEHDRTGKNEKTTLKSQRNSGKSKESAIITHTAMSISF
jgi:hypothetical protein